MLAGKEVGTPRPDVSTWPGCMVVRTLACAPEPGPEEPRLELPVAVGQPRTEWQAGLMEPSGLVGLELAGRLLMARRRLSGCRTASGWSKMIVQGQPVGGPSGGPEICGSRPPC